MIELLVVITIVGLLSSISFYSIHLTRIKARDSKRKANLAQIQKGLELYYDKFGVYPSEDVCDSSRGSCASCPCPGSDWDYAGTDIAQVLKNNKIIANLPKDPLNNATYYYSYEPDCNQNKCPAPAGCCYYSLTARLEGGGTSFSLTGGR